MESVEGVAQAGYFEERYGHRAWGWYSRLLANVVRYSRPGRILDVGAGHGLFTEAATRWGMDCVGIEGSRHGLEMAQARFPENRIVQGVLQEPLPFDDEQFQTVQMHQVIVCVAPDVVHFAFTEALRVLKPGGMFFVASDNRLRRRATDPTIVNGYTPKELAVLLRSVGFTGLIPQNAPRDVLGRTRIGRGIASVLFRALPIDRLSATATFLAFKP